MPWNWIVLPTMPAPGAALVSTLRYWFVLVPLEVKSPSSPTSFLSGRIATRLPPAVTQFVSVVTWGVLNDVFPRTTTSNCASKAADSNETSMVVNVVRPSLRRISPRYVVNGLDAAVTTSTFDGDPSVVNDQPTSAVSGLPKKSWTPPVPPFTVTVYVAPNCSAACGVSVAVFVVALYDTVAGMTVDAAFFSWIRLDVIVLAFIGSLKVAVGDTPMLTPVAPFAGVNAVTVGGVVSFWICDAMSVWISPGPRARS